MSIVDLVWACGSLRYELIVRKDENGEEYGEKLYPEGPCRSLSMQRDTLLDFVQLGLRAGWQPQGALLMEIKSMVFYPLEPGVEVIQSYDPAKLAEFKLVLAPDAAAWAQALERALAELEAGKEAFAFTRGERTLQEGMTPATFARINHPDPGKFTREFIAFLQQGPFQFFYRD